MVQEADLELNDGRKLHYYDTHPDDTGERLPVFWHHGTPGTGAPPEPLLQAAESDGLRWVSYDRPGYGGSPSRPGRDAASAAKDVTAVADALKIGSFAVLGHSGGGPHALACAALLPERVLSVVSVSGLAPFGADGLDWYAGMVASGAAELRAAAQGRAALEAYLSSAGFDEEMFTSSDHAALSGTWSWLAGVATQAVEAGLGGMVDDDLAYVTPWGFGPRQVTAPALFLHGEQDRIVPSTHGEWLARQCPSAELRLFPEDGHVSVLYHGAPMLDWLRANGPRR
jgi:pimeloyl-ACP methyl ester carboxylesterase